MRLETLPIHSHIRDYTVQLEPNPRFVQDLLKEELSFWVVDKNVWQLYKEPLFSSAKTDNFYILDAKEENKTLDCVCEIYKKILTLAPKRNLHLISMGGGIVQDVTGFVASTLYRGIRWTFIPTTLLAQVDSCIGAKTSLNFLHYKNLIGSFYPPDRVRVWPGFVNTLKTLDYYSGIGEMAKLHLMAGEDTTQKFIANLPALDKRDEAVLLDFISACLRIKKSYIEKDEFDTGIRNLLNYGHCFGHALESASCFKISHGQAVVLGMLLANRYASQNGMLQKQQEEFVRKEMLLPILKINAGDLPSRPEEAVAAMKHDKKNVGKGLALIILEDNYQLRKLTDVSLESASLLLQRLKNLIYD